MHGGLRDSGAKMLLCCFMAFAGREAGVKKIVVVSQCFGWRNETRSQQRFSAIRFMVLVGFHGGARKMKA